jgi:hypothetical protein
MYVETGVDYSPLTAGTTIQVVEGARVVAVGTILRRWTAPGDWRSNQRHNTR